MADSDVKVYEGTGVVAFYNDSDKLGRINLSGSPDRPYFDAAVLRKVGLTSIKKGTRVSVTYILEKVTGPRIEEPWATELKIRQETLVEVPPKTVQKTAAPVSRVTAQKIEGEHGPAVGHIKFFRYDKGYGFIERPGKPDVFVHISVLENAGLKDPHPGDEIRFYFKVDATRKEGVVATRVVR